MTTTQIDDEARATLETDRKARERRRRQLGARLKASLPEWRREKLERPSVIGLSARTVSAQVCRGLAVHGRPHVWCITHVASGQNAEQGIRSEHQAKVLVIRLAVLADWTQPMEALTSNPAAREAIRLLRERWAHDPYGPGPDLPGESEGAG